MRILKIPLLLGVLLCFLSCSDLLDIEKEIEIINKDTTDNDPVVDVTGFLAEIEVFDEQEFPGQKHSTTVKFGLHSDATFGDGSDGNTTGMLDNALGEVELPWMGYQYGVIYATWLVPSIDYLKVNVYPTNSDIYQYQSAIYKLAIRPELEFGSEYPFFIKWNKNDIPGIKDVKKNPDGRSFTFMDAETKGQIFKVNMKTGEYDGGNSSIDIVENNEQIVIRGYSNSYMSVSFEILCE